MKAAESAPNRRKKGRAVAGARPDFSLEAAAQARLGQGAIIIGVDEVGRGPMAGPVVAAAAWLSAAAATGLADAGLDDSKRLSEPRRDALFQALCALERQGRARIALAAGSCAQIERINILQASLSAMRSAALRLEQRMQAAPALALIDGNRAPSGLPCPAQTIIGGDGAALSIAAAALAAKVTRDRLMRRLALRYPAYEWARNVGYGSAAHRAAILRHGLTPHHRRGFCRRLLDGAAARGEAEEGAARHVEEG